MRVYNGTKGRPASVETYTGEPPAPAPRTPTFAPQLARIAEAEAEVEAAVAAHVAAPTQATAVRLLDTQLVVASLRAQLARLCNDSAVAATESSLVVKLAKSRDDAVSKLWGDELDQLHALVTRVGGVHASIAAELATELGDDDGEPSAPEETP